MAEIQNLIAFSVGNTRTQVARFSDGRLEQVERFPNADLSPIVQLVSGWWKEFGSSDANSLLMASVNDSVADRLASAIEDQLTEEVYRIGEDVPVPIGMQLDPETITGVDRLLNAAAAFATLKQACVIVDAGTAITVDFVDGEGTFHGGAIAPGASMQLAALHEHTEALPSVAFAAPNDEPFGRNTTQAMLQGVYHGIRGMVQRLTERYALAYEAYPLVIATGGDAKMLFEHEELIDRIVPDLTLLGIAVAAKHSIDGDADHHAGRDGDEDDDDDEPIRSHQPSRKATRLAGRTEDHPGHEHGPGHTHDENCDCGHEHHSDAGHARHDDDELG